MLDSILDIFIPQFIRRRITDRAVESLINVSQDERWRKLMQSFHSDAEFYASFEQALKRAVERFAIEYPDGEMASALTHNTRFWDIPKVQNALREIVTRPSSYLGPERNTLFQSFADVLPTLEPIRVEHTVNFFMRCLAEEVITIPQLAPIYQVQLQKATLEQAYQMVTALRELHTDQRQLMTELLESGSRERLLLTTPIDHLPNRTLPKVHHNLPPTYGDFLGREKDMARVVEGLQSRWPLISIEGLAGIGKTTLAIETARHCLTGPNAALESPFETVVWISAGDRPEQKRWMNELLDTIARVLGYRYVLQVPPEQKPTEVEHLLRNHRALVIVDNFETIDDPELLDWIQRVPEPSKALITTRHHHLRRVWDVHLKGLETREALDFVRLQARRLGLLSLESAGENILLPLVMVTEGNPKIIEMALGHVKGGGLSLEEVIDHLHDANQTLGDVFDYLFARSWEIMTKDAHYILLVIPFFADSVSKEALGTASGLSSYRLDTAIEQLVELAILDINEEWTLSGQRYSNHPLIRAFASTKLQELPEFEEQAKLRWRTYYLDLAARNLVRESFKENYWNVLSKRGNKLIDLDWLNLQQVLRWADQRGDDILLISLTTLLVHYMYRRLLYSERIFYARKAAEAAARLNRKKDEAFLRIDALGWLLIEEGLFEEARRELTIGLQIAQHLQDETSGATDLVALATTFLARSYLEEGEVDKASELINNAMTKECEPIVECRVYMVAGDVAFKKENQSAAINLYKYALQITQVQEDVDFEARLHYCLGSAYLVSGELTNADIEFNKVLEIEQQAVNIVIIYAKYGAARVAFAKGEKEKAHLLARDAFEELSRSIASHQLLNQIEDFLNILQD